MTTFVEDKPGQWTVLEIFGHRKRAGLVTEVEKFGGKFARVDIYLDESETPARTENYAAGSIFGFHSCTKEYAIALSKACAYQWQDEQPRALLGSVSDGGDGVIDAGVVPPEDEETPAQAADGGDGDPF